MFDHAGERTVIYPKASPFGDKRLLGRGDPLQPPAERINTNMSRVLTFIIGTMVGGTFGVFAMCLAQIAKAADEHLEPPAEESGYETTHLEVI